jgi:hypothetical protein
MGHSAPEACPVTTRSDPLPCIPAKPGGGNYYPIEL